MTIAREEIFGPVLAIVGAADEDDAVRIANDTPYGLAGCVFSGSTERARSVARLILSWHHISTCWLTRQLRPLRGL
ncbi:aldehyde dehydrogenase family protein [Bradyrhizobium sp. DASA03005]|uniref:aldehyde dehydrogenase family protein n=1 Tax=Bradyrhizobium sp. SPXBL-02 TaxID=3395912 RepID=UPI003F7106A2